VSGEDAVSNALVEYLTLASTSTGQATFYNTVEDQDQALEIAHADPIHGRSRRNEVHLAQ
jgi:hypothetical protein